MYTSKMWGESKKKKKKKKKANKTPPKGRAPNKEGQNNKLI